MATNAQAWQNFLLRDCTENASNEFCWYGVRLCSDSLLVKSTFEVRFCSAEALRVARTVSVGVVVLTAGCLQSFEHVSIICELMQAQGTSSSPGLKCACHECEGLGRTVLGHRPNGHGASRQTIPRGGKSHGTVKKELRADTREVTSCLLVSPTNQLVSTEHFNK